MYIPPWAFTNGVPPEINKAWIKATAGAALAVLMTGAYLEGDRLQTRADEIENLSVPQIQAAHPELKASFTQANRDQAIERCYWLNTPTPACADTQEVRQLAAELRQHGALHNLGGLILGVGAIGALASALRRPKAP